MSINSSILVFYIKPIFRSLTRIGPCLRSVDRWRFGDLSNIVILPAFQPRQVTRGNRLLGHESPRLFARDEDDGVDGALQRQACNGRGGETRGGLSASISIAMVDKGRYGHE